MSGSVGDGTVIWEVGYLGRNWGYESAGVGVSFNIVAVNLSDTCVPEGRALTPMAEMLRAKKTRRAVFDIVMKCNRLLTIYNVLKICKSMLRIIVHSEEQKWLYMDNSEY